MNKHFQFSNNSNNIMLLLKSSTTKLPKNKAVLSFKIYVAIWSLVTVMRDCGIQLFYETLQ